MEKDGANHGAMEAFGTWQELLQSVETRSTHFSKIIISPSNIAEMCEDQPVGTSVQPSGIDRTPTSSCTAEL